MRIDTIIRRPDRAEGGITSAERATMAEHVKLWTARAFRTDPIEPEKIVPAIEGIYAAAGLPRPRVVIAPSPLVMVAAYGAATAIWADRGVTDATRDATRAATFDATRAATRAATNAATRAATYAATSAATYAATSAATYAAGPMAACKVLAGKAGVKYAQEWWCAYQGGNMWAAYECYLTAARDILGLRLPAHEAYAHWEQAAIHGGFRVMHEKFCIVSDFPEVLRVDDQNRPHCEDGPSHRWRDGWSLYHWHGVRVPAHWIEGTPDPAEILATREVEVRAAGIAILGMDKMLDRLDHRIIDSDPDPMHGDLIEVLLPDLPDPVRYLRAQCPRNGTICEGVPSTAKSVLEAQAWRVGIPASEFVYPSKRT